MRALPLLLCCGALLVAGCGGDGEAAEAPVTFTESDVTVVMKNNEFEPRDIVVESGATVTWVNEDGIDHDAVARDAALPKSQLFGKGKSYSATFDEPGKIDYVCTVHPGMDGSITVR